MKKRASIQTGILPFEVPPVRDVDELIVEGVRQNNLKNLYLRIPHNRITVICGVSGSGKSSLAFDTLFAEGRWRFIESLSTYTRLFLERMDRPLVDSIRNIRPAIAIEQKNPVRSSRSTVGTTTELSDYLRLLFARVGRMHCPCCGREISPHEPSGIAEGLARRFKNRRALIGFDIPLKGTVDETLEGLLKKGFIRIKAGGKIYDISEQKPDLTGEETISVVADRLIIKDRARLVESIESAFREGRDNMWIEVLEEGVFRFSRLLKCTDCNITVERPSPLVFSFNHPVGACPECKGFGNILRYDEDKVIPRKELSLRQGAIEPWTKPAYRWWYEELERYAEDYGIDLDKPFYKLSKREKRLIFEGTDDFEGIDEFFEYLEGKKYKLHVKVFLSKYKGQFTCGMCGGRRLKSTALNVKVGGRDIAQISSMTIEEAREFFKTLELTPYEQELSKEVMKQITLKLDFLYQTGLGYITLDRLTKTLSGGEAQRVTIATHLASSLSGVLYILDEPSVGLHPRDIDMLIHQIKKLSSQGNTLVVVEHDPSVIRASDYIIELGPGAGDRGGRVVWSGPSRDFFRSARTLTASYLTGKECIHVPRWRRKGDGRFLVLRGAEGNNLKNIDLKIPLKTITCITGVSGSGKSTLVMDTLYNALSLRMGMRAEKPLPYRALEGTENIRGVKLIDQAPIGRTPRSNPVTYIGGFDEIRHFFASLPASQNTGLTPGHFSFNTPGGRCEVCKGEGMERLEMYFLPDVYTRCGACGGRRYKPQVLDIKYRGKNIHDVLEMTFDEAGAFFPNLHTLQKKFSIIKDVGLGYLRLGQPATTLSGGEAQRLKIARELADTSTDGFLYILDEPTTGLHLDDTKKLLSVLGRLVDSGNTVLIVEHNLDLIKTADHIVDLGPEGGKRGGRIVCKGTPEEVARVKESHTGRYLRAVLS